MMNLKLVSMLGMCMLCTSSGATELDAVREAGNKFSMNLFSDYANHHTDSNLVMSPFSAWISLSMAAYGAGGQTFEEMKKSLSLPDNSETAFEGFKQILKELEEIKDVNLQIKNKFYISEGHKLKEQFVETIKKVFHCENSEFNNHEPKKAAADINDWVSGATNNKIQNLIDESEITEDLRMVILNAVYFKGDWASAFDASVTAPKEFYYNEDRDSRDYKKLVPTMTTTNEFLIGHLDDLKAKFIQLPYKNNDAKMTIVVPDRDNNLGEVLKNLKSLDVSQFEKSGHKGKVRLTLPKFKINSEVDLKESFERLGMHDSFSSRANFAAMSDEELEISKIKQKTFTEVNEQGSESAAATAEMMLTKSGPRFFEVNKPSLFFITVKNVIIMMGFIGDPQY